MNSALADLQADFQRFLLEGHEGDFAQRLATPEGGDGRRRMGVYLFAYHARLGGVLADVFAKTRAWLGDARFDVARVRYIQMHRSRSPSLDDYGAGFPTLLGDLWPDEPDLAELAWLDLAMRRVFDGPDAAPLDPAVLVELDEAAWERVRFALCPTLMLGVVTTNVGALWASFDVGAPVLPPPLERPMEVRVWRKGLQPHFRLIDSAEADALRAMQAGATFAQICEGLARAVDGHPVERAGQLLSAWLQDELIVGLDARALQDGCNAVR